jgi:hypothetical protein
MLHIIQANELTRKGNWRVRSASLSVLIINDETLALRIIFKDDNHLFHIIQLNDKLFSSTGLRLIQPSVYHHTMQARGTNQSPIMK